MIVGFPSFGCCSYILTHSLSLSLSLYSSGDTKILDTINKGFAEFRLDIGEVKKDVSQIHEVKKDVSQIQDALHRGENPSVSISRTDQGLHIKSTLQSGDNYIQFQPQIGKIPFLNEAQSELAKQSLIEGKHENFLVAYFTPFFINLVKKVDPNMVFVNSEYYSWLQGLSGDITNAAKPDGFIMDKSLVNFRGPYKDASVCPEQIFGELASWGVRCSINSIWDAKKKVSLAGYADLCNYLQRCGDGGRCYDGSWMNHKGVVYDAEKCYLVKSIRHTITHTTVFNWTDAGSYDLLKEFISHSDPWTKCLYALCDMLGVKVVVPVTTNAVTTAQLGGSFLGSGACGRVFKVFYPIDESITYAMKLVISTDEEEGRIGEVENEFCQLNNAKGEGVIPVVSDSLKLSSVNLNSKTLLFGGYLMSVVGCPVENNKTNVKKMLESLNRLHKRGIYHGDARIQNVVQWEDTIYWVDFRTSSLSASSVFISNDVKQFLESAHVEFDKSVIATYKDNLNMQELLNNIKL